MFPPGANLFPLVTKHSWSDPTAQYQAPPPFYLQSHVGNQFLHRGVRTPVTPEVTCGFKPSAPDAPAPRDADGPAAPATEPTLTAN